MAAVPVSVVSFCTLCSLLVVGKLLRLKLRICQILYLPSSVIGGILGLILIQLSKINDDLDEAVEEDVIQGWSELPGFLINVVFSSLFLGVQIPATSVVWEKSGPQLMYGMVVAWGQEFIGCFLTAVLLKPVWDVDDLFATILPVGFAGGHGTAGGLSDTYESHDFDEGGDLGLASATIGLTLSIMLGVMWVNIAARRGWVVKAKMDSSPEARLRITGVYPVHERPKAGMQTVSSDSIDTLAFHLAIIGMAMLIGAGIKGGFVLIEKQSSALEDVGFFSGFPLFPLCMGGGILIQLFMEKTGSTSLVDVSLMERIAGTALDFLITAAVATVDVEAVKDNIVPFMILIGAGLLWHNLCISTFAPQMLPNHWFERGICELGMSMGVIASGLVLLRMTDPESETPVPADFAYKQLLHSPFMGGGLWTALSIPLISTAGLWPTTCITAFFLCMWVYLWWFYFRPKYTRVCKCKQCAGGDDKSAHLLENEIPQASGSSDDSGRDGNRTGSASAGGGPSAV
eukprot:Rmarinus@m.22641